MPAIRKTKKSTKNDDSLYDGALSSDSSTEQEQEVKRAVPRKRVERKGPWLPAEDAVLVALVSRLGAHSWSKIATHIPGRVGKQCRERYYNHLAPEVNKDPWTPEEEVKVMKLHALHGNSWALISRLLNTGRTANDVKNLWNCALKKRMLEVSDNDSSQMPCCSCKRRTRTAGKSQLSPSSDLEDPCDYTVSAHGAPQSSSCSSSPATQLSLKLEVCVKPDESCALSSEALPYTEVVVSPPASASPSPFVSPGSLELCGGVIPSFFDSVPESSTLGCAELSDTFTFASWGQWAHEFDMDS